MKWTEYIRNGTGRAKEDSIEIDTLEYQQTEKIETELEDVDRIRTRGGNATPLPALATWGR
jgi:hypothetical protein